MYIFLDSIVLIRMMNIVQTMLSYTTSKSICCRRKNNKDTLIRQQWAAACSNRQAMRDFIL